MKQLLIFFFTFNIELSSAFAVVAPNPGQESEEYAIGKVERILQEKETVENGEKEIIQEVQVEFPTKTGVEKKIINYGGEINLQEQQKVHVGEKVVINTASDGTDTHWFLIDKYRIPFAFFVFLIFCALIAIIVGVQGILSLIGLVISLLILTFWVAPHILTGMSPLIAGIIGSFAIATISMFLAHGFKVRTVLALVSTLGTLMISIVLSWIFVKFTLLSGIGSEDAFFLTMASNIHLNLQGILLAGIMIGTLGILDDITATQVAAVEELKISNPALTQKELFTQGFRIGKEHILSMVNTLALAYAGASFPMFLMLTMPDEQPLWVSLNSELIIEEIIRTLVGSIALVLAVPISCYLAAWYFGRSK